MKIDMSEKAVTNRLKTVNQLRKACLSLANSSAGKRIREQFSANIYMASACQEKNSPIDRKSENK